MDRFPLELTLVIVETGGLDVEDGLAIRGTCRSLFRASENRLFWLAIAIKIQIAHALPIPSLRSLKSMSSSEIMAACVRYKQTRDNLWSAAPSPRRERTLRMQDQESPVSYWNFLPGGRYVLTYHLDGVVNLWDVEHPQEERLSGVPRSNGSTSSPVGTLLATYETHFTPNTSNFCTSGDHDESVLCAVTSAYQSSSTSICVFRFSFHDTDRVDVEDLHRSKLPIWNPVIALSGSLVVFTGGWGEFFARVAIVDWTDGRRVCIDSGLDFDAAFDTHLVGDDLLLHYCTDVEMAVEAYFDISRFMKTATTACCPVISLSPDASRTIPYEKASCLSHTLSYFTISPFNTPNARTPPYLTVVTMTNDSRTRGSVLTVQHVDLRVILRRLKDNLAAEKIIPNMTRSIHRSTRPAVTVRPGENELMVLGTSGELLVWVSGPDVLQRQQSTPELTLGLLHLSALDQDDPPRTMTHRTLDVPFDLKEVTMMDGCDEAGILGFSMESVPGSKEQIIHLLNY